MKAAVDATLLRLLATAGKVTGAGKGRNYTVKELAKYKAYVSFEEGKFGKAIKLKLTAAGRQLLIKNSASNSSNPCSELPGPLANLLKDFQARGAKIMLMGDLHHGEPGVMKGFVVEKPKPTEPTVQGNALEMVLTQMLSNGSITFTQWAEKNAPQLAVKRGILFVGSAEHAESVSNALNFYGIKSAILDGNESLETLKQKALDFHQGKISYIVTLRRGNQMPTPFDFYSGPAIPPELYLYGEPHITSVYDLATYDLRFTTVDWRSAKNVDTVLKFFPSKPTPDDVLDLHLLNKELKSNRLDIFLKQIKTHVH